MARVLLHASHAQVGGGLAAGQKHWQAAPLQSRASSCCVTPVAMVVDAAGLRTFVAEFQEALTDLRQPQKSVISALTMLAAENKGAAASVAAVIENHLVTCKPEYRLPALYLLDSIAKNARDPYVQLFARNLPQMFLTAHESANTKTQASLERLFGTWRGVFPDAPINAIAAALDSRHLAQLQTLPHTQLVATGPSLSGAQEQLPPPPLRVVVQQQPFPAQGFPQSGGRVEQLPLPPQHFVDHGAAGVPPPYAQPAPYMQQPPQPQQQYLPPPALQQQQLPDFGQPAYGAFGGPPLQEQQQQAVGYAAASMQGPPQQQAGPAPVPDMSQLLSLLQTVQGAVQASTPPPASPGQAPTPPPPARYTPGAFDPNRLKAYDQAAVDDLAAASTANRSKHLDRLFLHRQRLRNVSQTTSRRWYVDMDNWMAGTAADGAVPVFFQAECQEEAAGAAPEASVQVDPLQPCCTLSGERFDQFWDKEHQEWRYRGAVRLDEEEAARYGVPPGSLVLASCLGSRSGPTPGSGGDAAPGPATATAGDVFESAGPAAALEQRLQAEEAAAELAAAAAGEGMGVQALPGLGALVGLEDVKPNVAALASGPGPHVPGTEAGVGVLPAGPHGGLEGSPAQGKRGAPELEGADACQQQQLEGAPAGKRARVDD